MERLLKAKLFGAELVEVSAPELVLRYNDCLSRLGIEPTGLMQFRIDGMGWSPEIAAEKENMFYLSAGEANPMAVVLVPEQRDKPVYLPYNSYDAALLAEYYERFSNEILDITLTNAIGLDIDQELTRYDSPRDLLLVKYIVVRSSCGKLAQLAAEQRDLVARFLGDGSGWCDPELRQAIIRSVQRSGDLRYRRVDIPDMRFEDLRSFHTRAFGGVFVIRGGPGCRMLVLERAETARGILSAGEETYSLYEEGLLLRLITESLVTCGVNGNQESVIYLQHKKECLAANLVFAADPLVALAQMTAAQKKQRLAALGSGIPDIYLELERLIKAAQGGGGIALGNVSPELLPLVLRPHPRLCTSERLVMWRLLTLLRPLDVVQLYRFDKHLFFNEYRTWPEAKRVWAADLLSRRHDLKVTALFS